ncbi:MAG: hypothetical protein CVU79_01190 [Elusimicrobia bacterium HGW-Elusimicrobia-3]|nr:MAG: hypothetical protein CVU79_01190 [Elusimicrobia bacterium HGW-Elusimicrobia-3]
MGIMPHAAARCFHAEYLLMIFSCKIASIHPSGCHRSRYQRPRFKAFAGWSLLLAAILLSTNFLLCTAAAQTELGSEDDLSVMGVDGTAVDPDVELKGFTVFGSTQAAYIGAVIGPGNVVVNGVLAVSSGAYFVDNSTFPSAGKIFIGDGMAGQILSKNAGGALEWASAGAMGDDLGNHIATTTLNMATFNIVSVGSITANAAITTYSSITAAGNLSVSTVIASGNITAARYQINGSTVLAVRDNGADIGSLFVGLGAGIKHTGNKGTFLGYNAGAQSVTSANNTYVGYEAGRLATGSNNTYVGHNAGYNSNTGFNNAFMGQGAGYSNTSGEGDVFVGPNAGRSNTTGKYNSFFGEYAAGDQITGWNNVVFGRYAGMRNVSGSGNTILGTEAAYGVTANSFSNSTVIGYKAGFAVTTGGNNVLLGYQAGNSLTTGAGNIIIGYDEDAPTATTNDYLNIGGLLYGDLSAKTVGISTRVPQAALDVVSTGTAHTEMAQIWRAGDGVIKGSMSATGVMMADKFIGDGSGLSGISGSGDDLGSHVATTTLNMGTFNLVNVSSVNFLSNVFMTSATAAQLGGVYVSTNMFVAGVSSATGYYGDGSTLTGVSTNTFKIGDSYGGGRIFWVDSKGQNALITATADQSGSIKWGNDTAVIGARLDGVYAGKADTVMISTMQGAGSYAARLCLDYAVTAGGVYYDDWYLPSKTELQLLYAQRDVVGGIGPNWYWSSNEYVDDTNFAWHVYFDGGLVNLASKTSSLSVRCVRGGPVSGFDHSRDAETARQLYAAPNVIVSSEASAALGAGVRVSSNVYIVGFASATKYFGDGSGLTNLPVFGDDLGNHIATTTLQMGAYGVNTSSDITAARYQIKGSTVLAILPGTASFAAGPSAGKANRAGYNSFFGSFAGEVNTTGSMNTYLGANTGFQHPTGYQNTFVGSSAGESSTAGNYNTLLGALAGASVAGSYNTFLGVETGMYTETNNNTFVGYNSGYSIDYGGDNTFIGSGAGSNSGNGGYNSFLGSSAGNGNRTGGSNAATGYKAAYYTRTGSANAIYGSQAGYGVTGQSFSSSTIMGYKAGYGLSTGSDNMLLGYQSGDSLTTGSRNIIIGYDEDAPSATTNDYLNIGGLLHGDMAQSTMTVYGDLYADKFYGDGSGLTGVSGSDDLGNHIATTTLQMGAYGVNTSSDITAARYQINGSTVLAMPGVESLALGTDAGRNNIGNYNVFVGSASGYSASTGWENAFLGAYSGYSTSSGDKNVAVGAYAGYGNNSNENVFVGAYSGYNNTGPWNTFVGAYAGNSNTTGADNVFIGENAGVGNTTGSTNICIGGWACAGNTTGKRNVAIGQDVAEYGTTGTDNTIMGDFAGQKSVTGAANAIYGAKAGYGATGYSFSSSTLMGYRAGYALRTGSDNIFLGYKAGYTVTTGTGNIVIGYDKTTPAVDTNNHLNIGGLVYGDLSAKTIGINRNSQMAALDVVSTGTAHTEMAQIWRDSSGIIVASMSATGVMQAVKFVGDGSGLSGVSGGSSGPSIDVSTINATATTPYGGVNITTNTYVQGRLGINTLNPQYALEVSSSAGFAGTMLAVSTGTSVMMEVKGTGELISKKVTVNGGPSKISNTVGDISIEPAGSNLNVTKNVTVPSDSTINLNGAGGNTYMYYDSFNHWLRIYVDGIEIARYEP